MYPPLPKYEVQCEKLKWNMTNLKHYLTVWTPIHVARVFPKIENWWLLRWRLKRWGSLRCCRLYRFSRAPFLTSYGQSPHPYQHDSHISPENIVKLCQIFFDTYWWCHNKLHESLLWHLNLTNNIKVECSSFTQKEGHLLRRPVSSLKCVILWFLMICDKIICQSRKSIFVCPQEIFTFVSGEEGILLYALNKFIGKFMVIHF